MLDGAVVALEEVLDHHLPVGLGLPLLAVVEHELVELKAAAGDDRRQVAEVVSKGWRGGIEIDERERAPGLEGGREQGKIRELESGFRLRPRRRAEPAVEIVGPRVIGTLQRTPVARATHYLVAPMTTHVDEGAEALLATNQHHG